VRNWPTRPSGWSEGSQDSGRTEPRPDTDQMKLLRHTMSAHLGVLRNADGMREALRTIHDAGTRSRYRTLRQCPDHGQADRGLRAQPHRKPGRPFPHRLSGEDDAWRRRTFTTLEQADKTIPALLEE
jgi:L-aspartate oxidase